MGKKAARRAAAEAAEASALLDKHVLYAQAVQSPKGDIAYLLRFHAQYLPGRPPPLHLREDFSGTSELCAAWCTSDARRTAVGVDLDKEELRYAADCVLANAGSAAGRTLLVCANVLDDPAHATPFNADAWTDDSCADWRSLWKRPADIVAALNSSLCLLHTREEAERYCASARANTASPGLFVLDMNGGHSMEKALELKTRLRGFDYIWSQDGFDPLTRTIRCHISFRIRGAAGQPQQTLRHAYSYSWRLWTLPEARDMLLGAGFKSVHVWMRRMREDGEESSDSESGSDGSDNEQSSDGSDSPGSGHREGKSRDEYVEVTAQGMTPQQRHRFAKGWQAYIVAVAS